MSNPLLSFVNVPTLLGELASTAALDEMFWQKMCEMQVAVPAVVVSFNASTQTVVVQPAIQEHLLIQGIPKPFSLPQLSNVPLGCLRMGGFSITFPAQAGDEGLVVFANMCIDAWWQSGGTSNIQIERRRHDLSDGLFFPMFWSQPRVIPNYSQTNLEIRTDDGTCKISIAPNGGVVITAPNNLTLNGNLIVNGSISSTGDAVMDGIDYKTHVHSGVSTGVGDSGPPVP